jgi:predicted small lipoprotein YifL
VRRIRRSLSVIAVARSPSVRRAAALSLVLALTLLAAGCGRRGPLEPPSAGIATPAPTPTASSDLSSQLGKPKNPPIAPPKTPFLLDPLL